MRRVQAVILALGLSLGMALPVWAEPLKVVSSFSILADMVQQVGGQHVQSTAIVGPEGDSHHFEPRPSDARQLGEADLLIINGAQFEEWLPRLMQSANYTGPVITATAGITLRAYKAHQTDHDHDADHDHDHGQFDPHAWQSLTHAQQYIRTIRDALINADPAHAQDYTTQAQDYIQQLQDLQAHVQAQFQALNLQQATVVTAHDAFAYLGQDYGVHFVPLMGATTQAEPSAKELAALIEWMREQGVDAVFAENMSNPQLLQQLARETGAQLGQVLYADALAKAPHPADSYLGLMQWNTQALLQALSKQAKENQQ